MKNPRRKRRASNTPLTEGQRSLAEDYFPLALKLAIPLKSAFPNWWHEFESTACMALVEAARSYDPSRNIRFATYLRHRVRNSLKDATRHLILKGFRDRRDFDGFPVIEPLSTEQISGDDPVGSDVESEDAFEAMMRRLPAANARACRLYYLHGKDMAEVASAMGVSLSNACRLHRQSIQLLGPAYGDDGRPFVPNILRRRSRKVRPCSEPPSVTTPA